MGMLAHLLGILTGWVGPLVIWLVKKDTSPFAGDQAKEVLNWEITLFIPIIALVVLNCGLAFLRVPFVGCLLYLLIVAIGIMNLIFAIQGAIAASKGVAYRYPFAVRLIK